MKKNLHEQLSQNEFDKLVGALPRIAILIAGADGIFNEEEKVWAEKLTHIRSYNHPSELEGLYEAADKVFTDQMTALTGTYPDDVTLRNQQISDELEDLNNILEKLDPKTGTSVYHSLTSFAKHIARSSGGFLGFGSISSAEAKWVELPMIQPVEDISEEE